MWKGNNIVKNIIGKDVRSRNKTGDFVVGESVLYKGKKRTIISVYSDPMHPSMNMYGLDGFDSALPRELKKIN